MKLFCAKKDNRKDERNQWDCGSMVRLLVKL